MLVGRFLEEDDKLTALKARLREEILQEVLDVIGGRTVQNGFGYRLIRFRANAYQSLVVREEFPSH